MHLIEPHGVRSFDTLADTTEILPLAEFLAMPDSGATVELETHSELESISEHLNDISQVFIKLDTFTDGRGFSLAYQLRNRLGFNKPIWAKGDLIADQFPHALRCGFDGVLVTEAHIQRQPFEHWSDALGAAPIPYRCHETRSAEQKCNSNLSIDDETIAHLNNKYSKLSSQELVTNIFGDQCFGNTALVSSFGIESAVLLHMLSLTDSNASVLFIDTGKLFTATLDYQKQLTQLLGLTNVQTLKPDENRLHSLDSFGVLHRSDIDSCCHIRKVEPLQNALSGFDAWVSGRKSFQSDSRHNLAIFEKSGTHIKINPLANWSRGQVENYMKEHNLPEHPLQNSGYQSIGCSPCTTPVAQHENARQGRWRGQNKTECGIHFIEGKVVRNKNIEAKPAERKNVYAAVGDSWSY